jgi:regulatory protein
MGKITKLSAQQANNQRINVFVDGVYILSLDLYQVAEFGIRVGKEYGEQELQALEEESVFGKLYARALEYTMIRPHSEHEVRDYLWRKTRDTKVRSKKTGELLTRKGVSEKIANRVLERLVQKGYVDDEKFARFWLENRNQRKGISHRKLEAELRAKGVTSDIIADAMQKYPRDEKSELLKIIEKKSKKYDDENKLIAYLARQGFSYDAIKDALAADTDDT